MLSQHCMAGMRWRVVVADESHMMRTQNRAPDAFFTEVAAAVGHRATRLLLLSGTPSLNRPFDLFRQARSGARRGFLWSYWGCEVWGLRSMK